MRSSKPEFMLIAEGVGVEAQRASLFHAGDDGRGAAVVQAANAGGSSAIEATDAVASASAAICTAPAARSSR